MSDRTYYDTPILKEPAWTVEVPWYLFAGGLAGASSIVSLAADIAHDPVLRRASGRAAAVGALASPVLLILDLGRPARFFNMLRLFKVTSPLSVGSWVLAAYAPAATANAVLGELGIWPAMRRLAAAGAATTGSVLSVYTGVLLADTAIPVWHAARRELPFVFAASSAAAAGAAAVVLQAADAGAGRGSGQGAGRGTAPAARRLAVAGCAAEVVAVATMERRLGPLGKPYHEGRSGRWASAAKKLTIAGAAGLVVGGRRWRWVNRAGAVAVLAGSLCQRFAVFTAGFASANDPTATISSQRAAD